MTRFARAKGSKASNERVPENATSWGEMKKDLKKTQTEAKTKEQREKMNELRQKSYDEFVDEEEKKVGKKWAEFPGKKTPLKAKTPMKATPKKGTPMKATPMKAKSKLNPKKKNISEDDDIIDDESEDETDPKVEEFKKEIEEVLKNQKNSAKTPPNSAKTPPKRKVPKNKDKEPKRRKNNLEEEMSVIVNGDTKKIVRFDGFPILEADADRLKELQKNLVKKSVPKSEIKRTIQQERRKAEKFLARVKKQVCFNCRKSGHMLSDCPDLASKNSSLIDHSGTGICFKCGSTEHKLNECKSKDGQALKYASCFICREQGHIARECPDNPRGLYPRGGACRMCGDVTHMKKDCPQVAQQGEKSVSVSTIGNGGVEALDEEKTAAPARRTPAKRVVKF